MLGSGERHEDECGNFLATITALTAERDAYHAQMLKEALLRKDSEDRHDNDRRYFNAMTRSYEANLAELRLRLEAKEGKA